MSTILEKIPITTFSVSSQPHVLLRLMTARTLSVVTFGALYNLALVRLVQREADPFLSGMFAAVYYAALLVTTLLSTHLSRWLTVARTFKLGTLLIGLALTGFALVENTAFWFFLQALLGIAAGLHWVAGQSWVVLSAPERLRGRIISLDQLLSGGGYAVSPLLLFLIGTSGTTPFLWCGGLLVLSFALIISLSAPRPKHEQISRSGIQANALTVLLPLLVIGFISGIAEDGSNAVLPIYGLGIGLTVEQVPLLVTVAGIGNLVIQLLIGQGADRLPLQTLQRVIQVFLLLIPLGFALLGNVGNSWMMYPLLFGLGGLFGSFYTLNLVIASRVTLPEQLTRTVSSIASVTTAGAIVGPLLNGFTLSVSSHHGLLLGSGSLVIVVCLIYPLLLVRKHGGKQ
jgi:MFS family permease